MSGFCFDTPVHFQITIAAVKGSTGFSNYLQDNSIAKSKQYPGVVPLGLPGSNPYYPPTASGLIEDGSVWEDNRVLDTGGLRSLNHFYDPISKRGLSLLWPWRSETYGLPSVAWASTNNIANPFNPPDFNQYSWQNARAYQSNAIVATVTFDRGQEAGEMFRSVWSGLTSSRRHRPTATRAE